MNIKVVRAALLAIVIINAIKIIHVISSSAHSSAKMSLSEEDKDHNDECLQKIIEVSANSEQRKSLIFLDFQPDFLHKIINSFRKKNNQGKQIYIFDRKQRFDFVNELKFFSSLHSQTLSHLLQKSMTIRIKKAETNQIIEMLRKINQPTILYQQSEGLPKILHQQNEFLQILEFQRQKGVDCLRKQINLLAERKQQREQFSKSKPKTYNGLNFLESFSKCEEQCHKKFFSFLSNQAIYFQEMSKSTKSMVWSYKPGQIEEILVTAENSNIFQILLSRSIAHKNTNISLIWFCLLPNCSSSSYSLSMFKHILPLVENFNSKADNKISQKLILNSHSDDGTRKTMMRNKILNDASYDIIGFQHNSVLKFGQGKLGTFIFSIPDFLVYYELAKQILLIGIQGVTAFSSFQKTKVLLLLTTEEIRQLENTYLIKKTENLFQISITGTIQFILQRNVMSNEFQYPNRIFCVSLLEEEEIISVKIKETKAQLIREKVHQKYLEEYQLQNVKGPGLLEEQHQKYITNRMQPPPPQKTKKNKKEIPTERGSKMNPEINKKEQENDNEFITKLSKYNFDEFDDWVLSDFSNVNSEVQNFCETPPEQNTNLFSFLLPKISKEQEIRIYYCLNNSFLLIQLVQKLVSLKKEEISTDVQILLCHEDQKINKKLMKISVLNDFNGLILRLEEQQMKGTLFFGDEKKEEIKSMFQVTNQKQDCKELIDEKWCIQSDINEG